MGALSVQYFEVISVEQFLRGIEKQHRVFIDVFRTIDLIDEKALVRLARAGLARGAHSPAPIHFFASDLVGQHVADFLEHVAQWLVQDPRWHGASSEEVQGALEILEKRFMCNIYRDAFFPHPQDEERDRVSRTFGLDGVFRRLCLSRRLT